MSSFTNIIQAETYCLYQNFLKKKNVLKILMKKIELEWCHTQNVASSVKMVEVVINYG